MLTCNYFLDEYICSLPSGHFWSIATTNKAAEVNTGAGNTPSPKFSNQGDWVWTASRPSDSCCSSRQGLTHHAHLTSWEQGLQCELPLPPSGQKQQQPWRGPWLLTARHRRCCSPLPSTWALGTQGGSGHTSEEVQKVRSHTAHPTQRACSCAKPSPFQPAALACTGIKEVSQLISPKLLLQQLKLSTVS